jgi:hypothetical protein
MFWRTRSQLPRLRRIRRHEGDFRPRTIRSAADARREIELVGSGPLIGVALSWRIDRTPLGHGTVDHGAMFRIVTIASCAVDNKLWMRCSTSHRRDFRFRCDGESALALLESADVHTVAALARAAASVVRRDASRECVVRSVGFGAGIAADGHARPPKMRTTSNRQGEAECSLGSTFRGKSIDKDFCRHRLWSHSKRALPA